ncbi:MAG: AmmeMemoRadiSam system protein B [Candidatus Omnitrophota bacterium]|jgi:AmmeMemoRadiSam system protein B
MIVRKPVAGGEAGRAFYLSSPPGLKNQIKGLIDEGQRKSEVIGCVLPHAGYEYSGKVAAAVLSRIVIRDKIILFGPNHTGEGPEFSIMSEGLWQTPLGAVKIDSHLAKDILGASKYLKDDFLAHKYEHSLEVELPLLQYLKKNFEIVPIAFRSDNLTALKEIGKTVAGVLGGKKECLLIASSDMTHYESQDAAEKKDKLAIEAILELNEDKLMDRVLKLGISMCGYAPVTALICAAKALGANRGELVKYQTSGESTGDFRSVVGYAGITIV